jgi:periplasmic divalent cation tolerance protein
MEHHMSSEEISFCYVTCPDMEIATNIASLAVNSQAAACVNILPGMTSVYRWEGKIEASVEVVLILKTNNKNIPALKDLVLQNHPYSCPCFVTLAVITGHEPYLNWIIESTKS